MLRGFSLFGIILVAFLLSVMEGAEAPRPNILYLYVDDMGWGSIGPNGQAARKARGLPYVLTPNLDRLAAEGINFTRGYGCHVCSPARSSLQTGFHQGHTFADRNDPNNAKKAIRADDPSIGKSLAEVGYITGYWGKWGYGGSKERQNPIIENVQTLPTSHGYRHVLAELHHVRAHTFFQPTLWSSATTADAIGGLQLVPNSLSRYRDGNSYPQFPARQDHADYPSTAYCDDSYAFAALDFVRTQGNHHNTTGEPFLGLLAVQIPHAPFDEISTLPDWDQAYADDPHFESLSAQSKQWAAMVTRIDAHFGNLLEALQDPNQDGDQSDSIADNTLVIFQSDNGGPAGRNNVEFNANGGLTGSKGKIQEGGIRVPLVMRWPDKIHKSSQPKAGTNCDLVVDVTDMLPTFCELAGATIPLGIDGVSIAPTLTGQGDQRKREFIIHEAGNGQSIIRDHLKLVRSKKGDLALFDLSTDHSESRNIAAEHPHLVQELDTLLIGERVAEPKGFANTYHHWIGADQALTSSAKNWSDYHYSNAGITYMTDSGAPRLSWVATMENVGVQPKTAQANKDLELLALELKGASPTATQGLVLGRGIDLTGRNEIRLGQHSSLSINGGTVRSLRWIDVSENGLIQGHGTIAAKLYNQGTLTLTRAGAKIEVLADYQQGESAVLQITLSENGCSALHVEGKATLSGFLKLDVDSSFKLKEAKQFTILSSSHLQGTFLNPDNEVTTENGTRFKIEYKDDAVLLTAQ